MKKISFAILALVVFVFQFAIFAQKTAAYDPLLATCPGAGDNGHGVFYADGYYLAESFVPGVNQITAISLTMRGIGTVLIGLSTSKTQVAGNLYQTTITLDTMDAKVYSSTFAPVTVNPSTTYYLFATSPSSESPTWTGVHNDDNCYAGGQAFIGGNFWTMMTSDYNFAIYGVNAAGATPADTGQTANSTTGTTGTSINAAIKAPTNIAAAFVETTNSAKISWTKSVTTDITGYHIYRSEEKTKGFTKVGEVTKDVAEYSDATVAASKTYYYYVRSYKTTEESPSSTTVTLVTPAFAAAPVVATKTSTAKPIETIGVNDKIDPLVYYLGGAAGVLFIFLIIYQIILRRKGFNSFNSFKFGKNKPKILE